MPIVNGLSAMERSLVTPHGITAIRGHKTLQEVICHTVAATCEQLAKGALASLERIGTRTKLSNPMARFDDLAFKPLESLG